MTFKEDFFKKYPKAPLNSDGAPNLCPWHVGYTIRGDCTNYDCHKCWNREMPEEKE